MGGEHGLGTPPTFTPTLALPRLRGREKTDRHRFRKLNDPGLTLTHERGKILRQLDRLGDFPLLRLEPSELALFVIVERGLTPHDQPRRSTRCQRLVDCNGRHWRSRLSASGDTPLRRTQ